MDLNLDDEEEEVGKEVAAFDPDVESMRSKMPEEEEEEEEDATLFPTFKAPQEIINEARKIKAKAAREAEAARSGKNGAAPTDTSKKTPKGDGDEDTSNDDENGNSTGTQDGMKTGL